MVKWLCVIIVILLIQDKMSAKETSIWLAVLNEEELLAKVLHPDQITGSSSPPSMINEQDEDFDVEGIDNDHGSSSNNAMEAGSALLAMPISESDINADGNDHCSQKRKRQQLEAPDQMLVNILDHQTATFDNQCGDNVQVPYHGYNQLGFVDGNTRNNHQMNNGANGSMPLQTLGFSSYPQLNNGQPVIPDGIPLNQVPPPFEDPGNQR